jgi:hypothetical protein
MRGCGRQIQLIELVLLLRSQDDAEYLSDSGVTWLSGRYDDDEVAGGDLS